MDLNTRVVVILLLISLSLFGLHRTGVMDTHHDLLSTHQQHNFLANDDGKSDASLSIYKDYIEMACEIDNLKTHRFCVLEILLTNNLTQGLNLSTYKNFIIDVEYITPHMGKKELPLRVYFRNYNTIYSDINDITSFKYNSVQFEPSITNTAQKIPLEYLQVSTWWIEENIIDYKNAQVDLSNISKIEISTAYLLEAGRYKIKLKKFILQGELFSEAILLKILLIVWLLTAIFLVNRQRRILKKVSNEDNLTHILNRRGLNHWFNKYFIKNSYIKEIVIFYIDIDDFKKVNDSHGHLIGDKLLINFSLIIKEEVNLYFDKYKINTNVLARLSGDEFALVFIDLGENQIDELANNLLSRFTKEISIDDIFLKVNASIGIAKSNNFNAHNAVNLMENADAAMYYAKNNGKNQYKIYDSIVFDQLVMRKKISTSLSTAIHNNEFKLVFMPIYKNISSLPIINIEVLLRCTSQSLKDIGPEIFIPIAEEFGLIKAIDLWVLENTFKLINYNDEFIKQKKLLFCINISAVELINKDFPQQIKLLLSQYNIDASLVELEITETSLINVDEDSISILNKLKTLGFKLSLDDFGTGYTAFNQLINYPIDTIKIDKSFVDKISNNKSHDSIMVDIILGIAESYQLNVIAEGVATQHQFNYLENKGCNALQGYYLSEPITWQEVKNKF